MQKSTLRWCALAEQLQLMTKVVQTSSKGIGAAYAMINAAVIPPSVWTIHMLVRGSFHKTHPSCTNSFYVVA